MPFDASTAQPLNGFDPSSAQPVQAQPQPQPQPQQQQQPDTSGGGLLQDAGQMLFTALHSAADTATFGLADKASAGLAMGISAATGKPMSFDEAYGKIQANNAKLRGQNPTSALVGDVAGIGLGAGGIARAAKLLPGAGAVTEALQPVARSPVTNVLKSAAAGGASAGAFTAADDAVRNGEVNPENVITNAVVGAAVAPAVTKIGTAIARGVQSSSTKAMTLLAGKLGETPAVLQRAYDNFNAATGRVPTMAELVGMKSTGELRQLAQDNPVIQQAANEASDTAASQRPRALASIVDQNAGGPQDANQLITARRDRMTQAMDPIRTTSVGVDTTDVGLLSDPRVRNIIRADPNLSQRVRDAIQDVNDNGQSDILTVNDIDSIRKSIRGQQTAYLNPTNPRHNPHIASQFGDLADNIAALGTAAEPGYADALSQFEADSHYIAGFKHGNAGKTIGEADRPDLIASLDTPEGQAGHQAGIATRVGDAAGSSNAGATRTAADLAEGAGGDTATLRQSIGQTRFAPIQRAAAAESQSAENLRNISGRVQPEDEAFSGKQAAQAVGAAASHSPSGMLFHLSRVMPSFTKLSQPVQTQIARYLLNPQMTQQGINLLRRAGAKDDQIRKLAVALSTSAGANTAATMQQ